MSGISRNIVPITDGTTGTLPINRGGTGQTVADDALNALLPTQTGQGGKVLQTNGANTTWATASGSASPDINFVQSSGVQWDFEGTANGANPVGWTRYTNSAATPPTTFAAGSPNADWTFQGTTTSPLYGSVSGLLTKTANNRQGHGIATDVLTFTAGSTNDLNFISFNYDWGSATIANGDVVVYILDVTNSTLISPSTVNMPVGGKGVFRASFLATSSTQYRLYIHQATTAATSGYTLEIDQVVIGPAQNYSAPGIDQWRSYTPTSSWTTNSNTPTGRWRIVGDSIHVRTRQTFTGAPNAVNLTYSLPTGYTIDSTKVVDASGGGSSFGTARAEDGATGYSGSVTYDTSTTVRIGYGPSNSVWTNTVPFTFGSGDGVLTDFIVPVAELAGSAGGVGSNIEEYASNSDTSDAANTTAFVNSPAGSAFPSSAFSGNRDKRIRFQRPVQANDALLFEIDPRGNGQFSLHSALVQANAAAPISPFTIVNTTAYGAGRITPVSGSTTDYDVSLARYASAEGAASYAGAGTDWSANTGVARWRVRKVSGGLVQFGLATSTAAGLVSGGRVPGSLGTAAIVAGNVGETLTATPTSQTASGFNSTASIASVTLTAGVWLITATGSGQNGTRPTTGISAIGWDIYNLTTTTVLVRQRFTSGWNSSSSDTDSGYATAALVCTLVTSSSATIQFRVRCDEAAAGTGTPTASSFAEGLLQAVRIA